MGIMYNSNNVHVNGTQNLNLSSLIKRSKTASLQLQYNIICAALTPSARVSLPLSG